MKTISLFCNYFVILLFAGLSVNTAVAKTEKKERMEKVFDISPSGSLMIPTVSRTDIEILTWDRNEVKVIGEITYDGIDNKEDIDKLLNAFKDMNAESSKDVLKLYLNPIKSSEGSVKRTFFGLITTTTNARTVLHNDDIISTVINIKTAYTIWIPATLDVKIDSKFGKLKMASIKGNVNLTLSNNDLVMEDFGKSGIFDIKFSKATIGSGGVSKFNVRNGTVNVAEVGNVTIDSRFSKFNITKAINVTVKSYQDTFDFGMLNDIDASARFSTINIENNAGESKFDFYQCKLYAKNFKSMEIFSARFSKFNATDIGDVKINSSHQSEYNLATVSTLICQKSRFDKFKLDELAFSASFKEAYQTKININSTSALFTGFSGNTRFGNINLKINPNVAYNLNYNGTQGSLNGVSSDRFKTYTSDKSNSKTTILGLNDGAKCNIELVTYNTASKIE